MHRFSISCLDLSYPEAWNPSTTSQDRYVEVLMGFLEIWTLQKNTGTKKNLL